MRITEGFLVELVKEYPRGMENGSNKWEIRTSAGSNNRESAVPCIFLLQILLHTHDYLTNSIQNVSVATDEVPSPKLTLSEGGSRGNIES